MNDKMKQSVMTADMVSTLEKIYQNTAPAVQMEVASFWEASAGIRQQIPADLPEGTLTAPELSLARMVKLLSPEAQDVLHRIVDTLGN